MSSVDRIQQMLTVAMPDAKLINVWPLQGGISAHMNAFEIETSEGRQTLIARQPNAYAYRQHKNAAEHEFKTLKSLHTAGLPVQKPYFVEPQTEENPHPFFVIEYIDGRPEIAPIDPDDFLKKYAYQLAQIHQTDATNFDLRLQTKDHEPRRETSNDQLRENDIYDAIEAQKDLQPNKPVLRHGDFWPGNVLWQDGQIVGVIDWEETLIGEPLADVAICRLDLLWILGIDAMHHFTELYQSQMNLDMADLPYWDLCASLRPITNIDEWATSFPPLGRPDVTAETMSHDHQLFVDQALKSLR